MDATLCFKKTPSDYNYKGKTTWITIHPNRPWCFSANRLLGIKEAMFSKIILTRLNYLKMDSIICSGSLLITIQSELLLYVHLYLWLPLVVSSNSNFYFLTQNLHFPVNTGVAMDCKTYLPKQECQFLHLVMDELETYRRDGNKMRYWTTS